MLRKIVIGVVGVGVVVTGAMWAAATYFLDNATIAEQLKKRRLNGLTAHSFFRESCKQSFSQKFRLFYHRQPCLLREAISRSSH